MDGVVTHVYCNVFNTCNGEWMELSHTYTVRYLTREMENGWSCHTRIL
jgi:hypothetical protein